MTMNDKTRPNMKIIGDNSASGGRYAHAKIVGNGTINGDMECVTFKSVGDSRIEGNLKAEKVKTTGSIRIHGKTTAEEIRITGDLNLYGDLHAGHCRVRGGITTNGGIRAGDMSLMGYVTVKKNCEAELLKAEGQIRIDGLLNADDIDIKTHGASRISEIGGDRIVIRRGTASSLGKMLKFIFVPSSWNNATVIANSIEGDDIRLSGTRAKVVRGNNVAIESGCEIDLVEYKDQLRVSHGSSVKEKRKIGR